MLAYALELSMDGCLDYNTHRIEGSAFLLSECNFIFAVLNLTYIGELMVIIHDENNHEEK